MTIHSTSLIALSTGATIAIILGIFVLVLIVWGFAVYNGLVRKRQSCKESWADIDTELKRRHDLIPNLVSTVKGYAAHESDTLEEITKLRDDAVKIQAQSPFRTLQDRNSTGILAWKPDCACRSLSGSQGLKQLPRTTEGIVGD